MESMAIERPSLATEETVAGPRNGITMEKIEQEIKNRDLKSGAKYKPPKKKKNIMIESYDFTKKKGKKQLRLSDYQEAIIKYCKFGKKSTEGQGLEITGDKAKKVTVQYCIFEDFTSKVSNGGEPLRLGNSPQSGCIFECVIKNNIFRNCTQKDPEMISIKACKNRIEDNFFINNTTNVTVRHGGLNKIQHNYFKGNNGVRIHGTGNYVRYNCFADNKETGKLSPITVRWGSKPQDRHWKNNKPLGRKGASHDESAPARDTVIEGNEFKNCKITIRDFQDEDEHEKPEGTKKENNKEVRKFTFETRG
jgi:hypothetical protein